MAILNLTVQDIGLADSEVTRILDELDASERNARDDRRRSSRDYLRGTAVFVTLEASRPPTVAFQVRLRNISCTGVAFLSCGPITVGTRLRMELPTGEELETAERHAVVRRCRRVEKLIYEVGAEFEDGWGG
jgi:hypothetical protein